MVKRHYIGSANNLTACQERGIWGTNKPIERKIHIIGTHASMLQRQRILESYYSRRTFHFRSLNCITFFFNRKYNISL